MVRKICIDHQAKTTRYSELVQGHIDQVAQQLKKKKKPTARKNSVTPPPTENTNAPVVDKQPQDVAPKPIVHEEPVDTTPIPEPTTVAKDIPPPRPSDDVPTASPIKHDSTEEGEIHQSEPSAQQQELPATSSVSDPLVTEQTTADQIETRVSPSPMIIE